MDDYKYKAAPTCTGRYTVSSVRAYCLCMATAMVISNPLISSHITLPYVLFTLTRELGYFKERVITLHSYA